jgi:hypothetical protein
MLLSVFFPTTYNFYAFLILFKQHLKLSNFCLALKKYLRNAQNTSHFIESRVRGIISTAPAALSGLKVMNFKTLHFQPKVIATVRW